MPIVGKIESMTLAAAALAGLLSRVELSSFLAIGSATISQQDALARVETATES